MLRYEPSRLLPGRQAAAPGDPGKARRIGEQAEPNRGPGMGQDARFEVKDRGRVSADLVARFKAATRKVGPEDTDLAKATAVSLTLPNSGR